MLLGGFPYPCIGNNTKAMKAAIIEGKVAPTFKAHPSFPQPSDAAVVFLKSLLVRDPGMRSECARALNSKYISTSTQPASLSLPSFGPTLSIAHDTTKDEPAAETPQQRPLGNVEDLSSDDSTTCGESSEENYVHEDFEHVSHRIKAS